MKEEQKEEEKKKKVEQKMAQIEVKNEVRSFHSRSICTFSTGRVRCVRFGSSCSAWRRRKPRKKQLSSARRN